MHLIFIGYERRIRNMIKLSNIVENILSGDSVRKVARTRGYNIKAYKGYYPKDTDTDQPFFVMQRKSLFPSMHSDEDIKISGFFAANPRVARLFIFRGGVFGRFYLKFNNPKVFDGSGKRAGTLQFKKGGIEFRNAVRSGKYDGIIIKNTSDEDTIYIALNPTSIKLADETTYDDENQPIPLDKRFDSSISDFRY
jgi:hypothetical protein